MKCECGTEYIITEHKIAMRDKDNLVCDDCGKELLKWNGAHYFSSKKIN